MRREINLPINGNDEDLTRTNPEWKDWHWQQRNSLRSSKDIRKFYPNFPESEIEQLAGLEREYRFGLTPYLISLIESDEDENPKKDDPLYRLFFPETEVFKRESADGYNRVDSNWELKEDFPTPILQHKYPNKVLFRMTNSCLSYCNYCFEVARVSDKKIKKPTTSNGLWQDSLKYIQEHPEIEEVIVSGGDPLIINNKTLEEGLKSIREIPTIKSIRIHTRTLTHNPYRIDKELVEALKKYRVTELGIHIAHPNEITDDFKEALAQFDEYGYGSILKMAQIPLIKGVNDDPEVLHKLFMKLCADCRVKPYYLIHDMPWTPGAAEYRTSVKKGVELMSAMKRKISNVAMPEYIIVHHTGKITVPLECDGTPEFQYSQNEEGHPIIKFRNWKGKWETYLDGRN